MQSASKSLMDSLNEMYESGWLGHELLYTQSQNVEMLGSDFSHKLADQVLIPMNTYQTQFPEMRVRLFFLLLFTRARTRLRNVCAATEVHRTFRIWNK